MPFCTQCGKWLNDGETCTCRTATGGSFSNQNGGSNPPPYGQPYNNGQPVPPPPYPNQPYGQYPYYGQQQPPKKSYAWILAIIIPIVCFVLLVLAAILVPSYIGYTKKSKQIKINTDAHSLVKAANTALTEMDGGGEDIGGIYVITSDPEKNSEMSYPFDLGDFTERLDRYFTPDKNYSYFIIVKNGYTEYAAVSESWYGKKVPVGTFPGSSLHPRKYSFNGNYADAPDNCDLYTLYIEAFHELNNGDLS